VRVRVRVRVYCVEVFVFLIITLIVIPAVSTFTVKRVVIITWCVWYHDQHFDPLKQVGCAVTLIGVLLNTFLDSREARRIVKFKAD